MDAPLAAVHFGNLTLSAFVGADGNLNGITLADWDGAGLILGSELLAQMRRHNLSANRRRGGPVGLSGLSALAGHVCTKTLG